jgi:hypothetical protein
MSGCGGYKLMEGVEGEEAIVKQTNHHIHQRKIKIRIPQYYCGRIHAQDQFLILN